MSIAHDKRLARGSSGVGAVVSSPEVMAPLTLVQRHVPPAVESAMLGLLSGITAVDSIAIF